MTVATAKKEAAPVAESLEQVKLGDIEVDPKIQSRVSINLAYVDELVIDVRDNGATLPPLKARYDGSKYLLTDGFHRVIAYGRLGHKKVAVLVLPGNRQDARDDAVGANGTHGQRRTREDVANSISHALEDHPDYSNHQVAKLCRVHHSTVAAHRKELTRKVKDPEPTGGDGADVGPSIPADITQANGKAPTKSPASPKKPKASKAKEKAEQLSIDVKDGLGNAVPHHLRDIFADRVLHDMAKGLRQVLTPLDKMDVVEMSKSVLSRMKVLPWLHGKAANEALAELDKLKLQLQIACEAIEAGLPYSVCERCYGDGKVGNKKCDGCAGGGHLSKARHDELKEQSK